MIDGRASQTLFFKIDFSTTLGRRSVANLMGSNKPDQSTTLAVATLPACLTIGVLSILIGIWSSLVNRTVSQPYLVGRLRPFDIDLLLSYRLG